jgi:TatD DNase family protein
MELIDIGVNLHHRSFSADRDEVIGRAVDAGLSAMIVTGTSVKESQGALDLARQYPGVLFSTAGVHPHNARDFDQATILALNELASSNQVVAIGECGLDFNRDFSPRPAQEQCFEAQVELACDLGLPLFLHERDAHQRFMAILKPRRDRIRRAVVHCFTGNRRELKAYLDLDFHIGITGWICDDRRGTDLRELVSSIPMDRLMLETDAPFLIPRTMSPRPKNARNEPAFLKHVLYSVAMAAGKREEEVAATTTRTARKFFGLDAAACLDL